MDFGAGFVVGGGTVGFEGRVVGGLLELGELEAIEIVSDDSPA